MIEDYTNQTVSWQAKSSLNEYNEVTYAAAANIAARKVVKTKLVKNSLGEEELSTSRITTKTAIGINDLIDSVKVIAVDTSTDLDGTTLFYRAYLK